MIIGVALFVSGDLGCNFKSWFRMIRGMIERLEMSFECLGCVRLGFLWWFTFDGR